MPALLGSGTSVYDATTPVLLPSVSLAAVCSFFVTPIAAGLLSAQQAPVPATAEVTVRAAGPGVAPDALAAVRAAVDVELHDLRSVFPALPKSDFTVWVHASGDTLPADLAADHHGVPGLARLGGHEIHLVWADLRRSGARLGAVVKHELVHELLDQFAAPHGHLLPRWFHEGLAQYLAGDTYLGGREEDLVWRVVGGRLAAFAALRTSFPTDEQELQAAYGQSYSYVAWLAREYGLDALLRTVANVDDVTSFEGALVGATRRSTLQLVDAWKDHLLRRSGAGWRVLFDQCFTFLMIAALPVLALALIRRLAAERRAAARLDRAPENPPPLVDAAGGVDERSVDGAPPGRPGEADAAAGVPDRSPPPA